MIYTRLCMKWSSTCKISDLHICVIGMCCIGWCSENTHRCFKYTCGFLIYSSNSLMHPLYFLLISFVITVLFFNFALDVLINIITEYHKKLHSWGHDPVLEFGSWRFHFNPWNLFTSTRKLSFDFSSYIRASLCNTLSQQAI